jgi:hypothetical protein
MSRDRRLLGGATRHAGAENGRPLESRPANRDHQNKHDDYGDEDREVNHGANSLHGRYRSPSSRNVEVISRIKSLCRKWVDAAKPNEMNVAA